MRSLEAGRETLKYIGKTAAELSGIGRAKRAYKEEVSPSHAESLLYGAVNGVLAVGMPLSSKRTESHKEGIGPGFIIDLAANALAFNFLREGNIQAAFVAKFGYNLLVQIAPDVAKLAKGKIFYKVE